MLLLTAIGVASKRNIIIKDRGITLEEAIIPLLSTWTSRGRIPLEETIVEVLRLDDFINRNFSKKNYTVSLYIGYYLSQVKIGAVHSPLVCFPGQGWLLSDKKNISIPIGTDRVKLASMVISKGTDKYLVFYWFQAYDKTSPGTFMQKLILLRSKIILSKEDNAFVRVMVPLGNERDVQQAEEIGFDFIREFYPALRQYLIKG